MSPARTLSSLATAALASLLVAAGCADVTARQAQHDFPPDAELQAMVRYLVEDGETEGIVLGVLEADGSMRFAAYGDPGPGVAALGPESVFEIASVTKLFTASLLADMAARGEVALDDPVARYLPEHVQVPAYEGSPITLEHLATHTSALPRDPEGLPSFAEFTVDSLYAVLARTELERAPGAEFEYSNLGVGLLGHALARAAGKPLAELLDDRVLGPLGMADTGYDMDAAGDRMVRGFAAGIPLPSWEPTEAVAGAGGLRSTAADMLAFLDANAGPTTSPLEEAMRTAHEPRLEADGVGVGLVWRSSTLNGRPLLWHTGVVGGFRATAAIDPERGVAAVSLANSTAYGETLARDLLAMGPPPQVPEEPLSRDALEPLVGEYRSETGLPFSIRLDHDGWLTAQGRNQIRYRLHATSDSTFTTLRVPFAFTFTGARDGEADALVLDIQGRTNEFRRVADASPSSVELAGNVVPTLPPGDLPVYEGTYAVEMPNGTEEFRIYAMDGVLMVSRGEEQISPLVPAGEHTFTLAVSPATAVRFQVDGGRAVAVGIRVEEGVLTGRRVR